MSTDSSRVTAEKLSRAEAERRFWKAKHEAAILRNEVETMSPDMYGGIESKRIGVGKPTPLDRAAEAHTRGVELNMFNKGLTGDSATKPPQLDPNTVIQAKATIVKALAANHSAEQIALYLEKISPFLDTAMLAGGDPVTQSLLYSKIMSSNQPQLTTKDIIELITTVNQIRGSQQQPQTDVTGVANAMTNALKTGAELAKTNNSDPVQMLQMLNQNQQQSHQAQLQMYERLLETQQPRSLREQLTDIREMQDTLGKIAGKETPEIQMKRLDLLSQKEQREFERSIEVGRERRQEDMIRGIGGAIGKALESPILREAGKKMAETIPGMAKVAGTVGQVQSSAARSTLDQPLEEVFSFKCGTCGTDHRFSRKALTMIESSPTKLWACPRCGASYTLGQQAGTDPAEKKDDGSTGAF